MGADPRFSHPSLRGQPAGRGALLGRVPVDEPARHPGGKNAAMGAVRSGRERRRGALHGGRLDPGDGRPGA